MTAPGSSKAESGLGGGGTHDPSSAHDQPRPASDTPTGLTIDRRRTSPGPETRLLDRARAMAELRALFDPGNQHPVGAVILDGPVGSGRTALLNAACRAATQANARLLRARASEQEMHRPLGVVLQLVAQLHAAGSLVDSARELIARIDRSPSPALLDELHHALDEAVVDHAGHRTALVAVDDVQWSDPESVACLHYLARRAESRPFRLLLTATPAPPGLTVGPLDLLRQEASTRVIEVTPLSRAAVTKLLVGRLGSDLAVPDLVDACTEATGGNAGLLVALLEHLAEMAASGEHDLAARVADAAPPEVARSLVHRAAGASPDGLQILEAVAVLGRHASLAAIAHLTDLDLVATVLGVESLSRASVLTAGTVVSFCHPIEGSAIHQMLPTASRADLHDRAIAHLRSLDAPASEVAAHLMETIVPIDASAARTLLEAAREHRSEGRLDHARRCLVRSVDYFEPGSPLEAEARCELALVEGLLDLPSAADHLAGDGRPVSDHLATTLPTLVTMAGTGRPRLVECVRSLVRAGISGVGEPDPRTVVAHVLLNPRMSTPAALQQLEPALHGGLPGSDLALLLATTLVLDDPAPTTAAELGRQLTALLRAEALADPDPVVHAVALRAVVALTRVDRSADAARLVAEALELVPDHDVHGLARMLRVDARLAHQRGDFAQALASSHRAEQLGAAPTIGMAGVEAAWTAYLLTATKQSERARELLHEVERTATDLEHAPYLVPETIGWLALWDGEPDVAARRFIEAGRAADALGVRNPAVTSWRSGLARAHAERGERDDARRRALDSVELARAFAARVALARSLGALSHTSEPDERVALLREVTDLLDPDHPSPLSLRAHLDLGAALRESGDIAGARDVLRRVADAAQRMGAEDLADRAHHQLRLAGARPRRLALSGVASLTPAELRTARLAARGETNNRIAAMLFVSPKTVETHLAAVFRKLGVKARTELAELLDADD